jgi:PAS domain S-box-containing protein
MAHDLSRTTVSKSYVDNIINSMLDTLIVVDAEAKISMVNKSTLDLLGYEKKELIGKPINKIVAEESSRSSVIKQLISEDAIGNIEKTYLTKDGHNIPVLFSGAAMHTDNDELQGIVCVARDIIERKQAEVALKKAKDELELRVAERTVELQNANTHLQKEIEEHRRTEAALRESKGTLRLLSSQLLKVQEKERRRISLELHDELGQSLSLLKVQLGAIKRKLDDDQSDLIIDLEESRQYLNYIIESVRRLSRDLSPSILEDLGLSAALEWLVSDFSRHHNLSLSYTAENIDDFFSHEHQIIIYRIFQETLSNIGKHAEANDVFVKIKKRAHEVSFLIVDNGIGFDISQVSQEKPTEKGMGLAAMQERALIIGSSLDISTQPDKGTQISFKIPI